MHIFVNSFIFATLHYTFAISLCIATSKSKLLLYPCLCCGCSQSPGCAQCAQRTVMNINKRGLLLFALHRDAYSFIIFFPSQRNLIMPLLPRSNKRYCFGGSSMCVSSSVYVRASWVWFSVLWPWFWSSWLAAHLPSPVQSPTLPSLFWGWPGLPGFNNNRPLTLKSMPPTSGEHAKLKT